MGPSTRRKDDSCHKILFFTLSQITHIHIYQDSNRVLDQFSADKHPSLYHALPALEDLQTAWEAKLEDPQLEIYHDAIKDGLAKLMKYYCRFDEKPAYILALGKFCIVPLIYS